MHVFQRAALIEAAEAIGVKGLQPHEPRHPATMTLDLHATAHAPQFGRRRCVAPTGFEPAPPP